MAKYSIILLLSVFSLVKLEQSKKNVLLLIADDLRAQLGTYVKTPNIDALASKSLVFERAYCQVSICSPSRASFLTGRRPDTNHVWRVSPDEYWRTVTNATTIPQYFKENGYISAGMGKVFHPGMASGNDDSKYSWSVPYFHATDDVRSSDSWHCFDNVSDSALQDGKIADNAIKTLQQFKQNGGSDQPFFLAVGFHKPHLPFFAPSTYCGMYSDTKLPINPNAPANMPPIAWSTSQELMSYSDMNKYNLPECLSNATAAMSGKECMVSENDTMLLRQAYYTAISYMDSQVGRVINELSNQGLDSNTVIVFMGDHGWKLGEYNMWTKETNLEADTKVPFMLSVPGITDKAKGMRTEALVELIDLFPTLAEVAGLTVPPLCPEDSHNLLACVEGSSLAPLLQDPSQEWKKGAFSQFPRPFTGLSSIPGKPPFNNRQDRGESVMGYAIRVDQYRFVEWYQFDRDNGTPDWNNVWGTELYNHTHPVFFFNEENTNLVNDPTMQANVTQFRAMLQAGWRGVLQKQLKSF